MTDWVRLWHDMPTDPKWRTIARKSGQRVGDVIAVFNFLMVNASGNAMKRGTLSGFDIEDVATALDLSDADVEAIIAAMQGKVLEGDELTGWERRQPKREDNSAERVKTYRERKKSEANAEGRSETPCNAVKRNVTQRNAPETETETETDNNPLTPLRGKMPGWLPIDDWTAFEEMRRKIRKPLTDRARQLAIGKLDGFRKAGHNPAAVLQQSTLNCWQDLFEPRVKARSAVKVGI